uniref:transmembrane emp24 domain-containing protein 6-like n=1 Tax=Styela clava TaxID=7725 RepID=UPI001939F83C|nr:transmembrane emp24 domain-containing protein 6-like [Styela clava]
MVRGLFCLWLVYAIFLLLTKADNDGDRKKGAYMETIRNQLKTYVSPSSVDFFSDILAKKIYTNYEFKVVLPPKGTQCYFQEVKKMVSLQFEFQCVSAPSFRGEPVVSAWISHLQTGKTVQTVDEQRKGEMQLAVKEVGTYGFCVENKGRDPRFVQLSFEMLNTGDIPRFHLENQAGNDSMYHIYDGLFQVTRDVRIMRSAMMHTRSIVRYDYSMTTSNLSMVNNFSILSLILIFTVCGIQIHMVKKMFGTPKIGV